MWLLMIVSMIFSSVFASGERRDRSVGRVEVNVFVLFGDWNDVGCFPI